MLRVSFFFELGFGGAAWGRANTQLRRRGLLGRGIGAMTYLALALIVLNIGLVGLGLAHFRSSLTGRGRREKAQTGVEADAATSASLFQGLRETLSAHAGKIRDLQASRDTDRPAADNANLDVSDLRRSNRATADSLDAKGKKLAVLLKGYGDLYKSERIRIDHYAQQTKELDKQLASFEQDADGSNKVLLQLVRETLQENTQLRAKMSSCQEQVSELIVQSVKSGREARTDSLTRLPNRRAWDERLDAIQFDGQTSVALIDVDDFKLINDRHGHAAGDGMLNMIGTILLNTTRVSAFRLGGDEFALLMQPSSGQDDDRVAEGIRGRIAAAVLQFKGQRITTSVSIGVALGVIGEPIESVLFRADNALYAAKDAGGNQVQLNVNSTPPLEADEDSRELVEA